MKKQDLINLIRYHMDNNEEAFISEVSKIAREFDMNNDSITAEYLMELISTTNNYIPQTSYKDLKYLSKVNYSKKPLFLPTIIEEDILGITRAIKAKKDVSKFLFFGRPGSGKTESAYQIARLLNKDILSVDFERLVDSRLGETSKNVKLLFNEINSVSPNNSIIIFDEIDSLVLDRVNRNDLREMGRVTSTFLREIDSLNTKIPIIATTNLIKEFDKALLRRFDAMVSFNRYSKEDLIKIADAILSTNLRKSDNLRKDIRLFNKILNNLEEVPYPGDLEPLIRTSIAFSDESNKYDYLRRIYSAFNNKESISIRKLNEEGYTIREIEILTNIPKSSVSRKLKGE